MRTVVVTGGARGIGDAIVASFRELGDEVIALDLIAPETPHSGVRYIETDITDKQSVEAALAGLEGIDVLVNNAGIQRVGLTGALDLGDWQRVVEVHLTGAFICASAAVPRMRSGGAIVSIASTAAFVGLPGRGPYSAAKAGLVGWTRVLAMELAPRNIRANAVAPGFTATPFVEQALRDGSLQEDWILARVPLGRIARPEEIAHVVRFLAGGEASYITGQTIVADGGWTIQGISDAPAALKTERS